MQPCFILLLGCLSAAALLQASLAAPASIATITSKCSGLHAASILPATARQAADNLWALKGGPVSYNRVRLPCVLCATLSWLAMCVCHGMATWI